MPTKKERPAALSESILKARLTVEQAPDDFCGGMPEEIPVHNTFIQFGAPPGSLPKEKPLSTAPAWIGPSFQSMMQAAMQSSVQGPLQSPAVDADAEAVQAQAATDAGAEGSERSLEDLNTLGSPKKVPVMRYALSTSSARAAGLPEVGSVATAQPELVGDSTASKEADDDDEGEGEEDESGTEQQEQQQAHEQPEPLNAEATAAAVAAAKAGDLPSVGSAMHADGLCKRCCFFPKGRCLNGQDCEFCHFEHEKRKRKKKKKGAGARRDAAGSESDDDSQDDAPEPGAATAAAPKAASGASKAAAAAASTASSTGAGGRAARNSGGSAADKSSTAQSSPAAPDSAAAGFSSATEPPLGPLRAGVPLTAPPPLPPRGLPLPTEPPPPAPLQGLTPGAPLAADQFYGGYDPLGRGAAGYAGMAGYSGGSNYSRSVDPRISTLGHGTVAQAYYNAGAYDAASLIAAQQQHNQQQQAAYGQQPASGKYLPPPR